MSGKILFFILIVNVISFVSCGNNVTSNNDNDTVTVSPNSTISTTHALTAVSDQPTTIGAPAELVVSDLPDDNGGFVIASFVVSPEHLTSVTSYLFFRKIAIDEEEAKWVQWAIVAVHPADESNRMNVIIPTVWDTLTSWKVHAATGSVIPQNGEPPQGMSAPVAEIVYGKSGTIHDEVTSSASNIVTAMSADNIAPGEFTAFDARGTGVGQLHLALSWIVPEDHGIVDTYSFADETCYIYGVVTYEIYRRKAFSNESAELIWSKGPLSTTFPDSTVDKFTLYEYYIKAYDGNPGHVVFSPAAKAMVSTGLGDLVLFGALWGSREGDADWYPIFDLNGDGEVGLGDLVVIGTFWADRFTSYSY